MPLRQVTLLSLHPQTYSHCSPTSVSQWWQCWDINLKYWPKGVIALSSYAGCLCSYQVGDSRCWWIWRRLNHAFLPQTRADGVRIVFFDDFLFPSHTCFLHSQTSQIVVLGVDSIRKDSGFILCLCSLFVICVQFTWGHVLQGPRGLSDEQWKEPIRNVKS